MSTSPPMEIINSHCHLWGLAGIARLPKLLAPNGVARLNLAALSQMGEQAILQNVTELLAKVTYPGTIYAYGGLHYTLPGMTRAGWHLGAQVRALHAMGFDGVKMWEGKPTVMQALDLNLDDPVLDDVFGYLQEYELPLLWHVGDPEEFWDPARCPAWARDAGWCYGDDYVHIETMYDQVERVLGRFPRLRVTFAHFFFLSAQLPRAAALLDRYPNVCLDVVPGSEMYGNFSRDPEATRSFFTRYADRILFGTDDFASEALGDDEHDPCWLTSIVRRFLETDDVFEGWGYTIHGIALDAPSLALLYRDNFTRLAGATPRPVALPAAIEETDRLLRLAEAHALSPDVTTTLRGVLQGLAENGYDYPGA